MRVLFDQGTPVPLRAFLPGYEIATTFERGSATLSNGELLYAAETDGFDILITTARNLGYQLNLSKRRIAILALSTTNWPRIRDAGNLVLEAVRTACGWVRRNRYPMTPNPAFQRTACGRR